MVWDIFGKKCIAIIPELSIFRLRNLTSSTEVDGVQDPIGYKLTMVSRRRVFFLLREKREKTEADVLLRGVFSSKRLNNR